jgi:hypothetical protein
MLAVAESIVTRHNVTVPVGLGIPGPDGQIYSTWYPLQSLLSLPFVMAASGTARLLHIPLHFLAATFVGVVPAVCTAASVAFVALISLQLGSTPQGARRAALCFAAGTIAMVYARTFYAEPLLSLLVSGGIYLVFIRSNRSIRVAALIALLAVLAKPTGILLGPALSAYLFWKKTPTRFALTPAVGAGLGLFLYSLYNLLRFGNPWYFGPPWVFSLSALPEGLAGLLFSPGRGIIWYCPAVLLAILGLRRAAKTKPIEALLISALFIGFLGLHSLVPYWHGGWSWGPRYLLPVLPGMMAMTSLLEGRAAKALLVLSLLGFVLNAPTLVSFYERYYAEANEQGISDSELYWSPSRAPLLHGWGAASRVIADARNQDVRELFSQRNTPSDKIASSRALRIVALWWWVLPIVHIPRVVGAVCSFAMVLLGCRVLWKVRVCSSQLVEASPSASVTVKTLTP